jgi:hypothetical protein
MNLSSRCFVILAASVLLSLPAGRQSLQVLPFQGPGLEFTPMKEGLRSGLCNSIAGFIAGPLNSQIPTFAAIEGQSHVVIADLKSLIFRLHVVENATKLEIAIFDI